MIVLFGLSVFGYYLGYQKGYLNGSADISQQLDRVPLQYRAKLQSMPGPSDPLEEDQPEFSGDAVSAQAAAQLREEDR